MKYKLNKKSTYNWQQIILLKIKKNFIQINYSFKDKIFFYILDNLKLICYYI